MFIMRLFSTVVVVAYEDKSIVPQLAVEPLVVKYLPLLPVWLGKASTAAT